MPLSLEAKDRALRAILAAGPVLVGLLVGDEEETDANYRRQDVIMLPAESGLSDEYVNRGEVRFPGWAGPSTVTGWALYDGAGTELSREAFETARAVKARERLFFETGALVVRLEG